MRAALGIVWPTCLLVLAGYGVLLGLGIVRLTLRSALPALGLAYLAGVCAVFLVGVALLVAGVGFHLPLFTATCLVFMVGGVLLGARASSLSREGELGRDPALPRVVKPSLTILGLLTAGYLVVLLLAAAVQPMDAWDAWSIWTHKAMLLAHFDGLPERFFAGPAYGFMQQEYPLLLPLLESIHLRAMGEENQAALHAVPWLLMVGFVGALGFLTWRVRSSGAWLATLLLAALVPGAYWQLKTGYADFPMAFLLGAGVLSLGLWLRSGQQGELALASLLLAGAASVKIEALPMVAFGFVAAALLLAHGREWAQLRRVVLAGAGVVLMVMPWLIWLAIHDIRSEVPLADGLTPSYLIDRLERLWPAMKALSWDLLKQGGWIAPVACLTIALALRARPDRRIAAFYLVTAAGAFASVLWVFVVKEEALQSQIDNAAGRVVIGSLFILLAGMAQLWSESSGRRRVETGGMT